MKKIRKISDRNPKEIEIQIIIMEENNCKVNWDREVKYNSYSDCGLGNCSCGITATKIFELFKEWNPKIISNIVVETVNDKGNTVWIVTK